MSTRLTTIAAGDGDLRHGSANGYKNLGCRCDACRLANARTGREEKEARKLRGLPPGDPRHGSENGYGNWGCRCTPCTRVWTAGTLDRRKRKKATADRLKAQREKENAL